MKLTVNRYLALPRDERTIVDEWLESEGLRNRYVTCIDTRDGVVLRVTGCKLRDGKPYQAPDFRIVETTWTQLAGKPFPFMSARQ